jgi:hypothetical protein
MNWKEYEEKLSWPDLSRETRENNDIIPFRIAGEPE